MQNNKKIFGIIIYGLLRVLVFSQRHFPKGNFPRTTSQVTISKMRIFPRGIFPKVRLGPLRHCRLQKVPSAAARSSKLGGKALRLGQTWDVAAWEIEYLGSCNLGK